MSTVKKPIINCHTHVFIGESIPPQIAKTFVPWPLYLMLTTKFILKLCRFWYLNRKWSPNYWKYKEWYRWFRVFYYNYRVLLRRKVWARILILNILNTLIAYHGILYLLNQITTNSAFSWLSDHWLFWNPASDIFKNFVIIFTFLFIATGRKIIFFISKQAWSFLKFLPDQKTIKFIIRYVNIGRFAYYKSSAASFERLQNQYPTGTGFVLLPMDMEFMEAGEIKPDGDYRFQMNELYDIKSRNPDVAFPFVFVDPRRKHVNGQPFFEWTHNGNGNVVLTTCFIKEFIEEKKFNGFKIYPALGYYPFDETLLPLWKYAADNGLPITTHCIRGTIFYRGGKKKEWDTHKIFKDCYDEGVKKPMLLSDLDNVDFINNFTHPLNYLCLVEERLLRILVESAAPEVKQLFGFSDADTPLKYDLKHLKLCFGHYGGDDEWQRYFDMDRDNPGSRIVTFPLQGLSFMAAGKAENSEGTLMNIWKSVDWYTIISSMLLQYPNLYADISYIIHNDSIFPLLKSTLRNPNLLKKVLFGTDFFVVRNHKSEKEMLSDSLAALSDEEFDAIARDNPAQFLMRFPMNDDLQV